MSNLLKMMAGAGIAAPLYVDDVFSAYLAVNTGGTHTVVNGIDLLNKGGTVWTKDRINARSHEVSNTGMGVNYHLSPNTADLSYSSSYEVVTQFNNNGFIYSNGYASGNYVHWTFRNAPNFYGHQVVVKSSGSNQTALFPELTTLGMVRVKRTDSTGSWYVWHRSLTAGKLLIGGTTAAEATLGHITVSGTTVTLVDAVIADGTYLVEAWAHDTSAEGIVQCGTFTTDGSGNATVTLGWEPQFLLYKNSTGTAANWVTLDTMRGWTDATSGTQVLFPNLSNAEASTTRGPVNATGFSMTSLVASTTYIYLAIRRPNKPPTVGTQVYNAIARTGTGAAATVTGVGFAPDLVLVHRRDSTSGYTWGDRLRAVSTWLASTDTGAEGPNNGDFTSFTMDGVITGIGGGSNVSGATYINHFFRRAPGFFDSSCDTGTGANKTESHNLGVAPELVIRKGRSGATQWEVWHSGIANTEKLILNSTAAKATDTTAWNSTSPTASVFTVGTGANVNTNTATYVTYLFATLAGLSKCFSFTGNGTNQNIECGFTTGARFVLIKRTDSTGDWMIADVVRGLVSGNDPSLALNSTAAEVTTLDWIDPYSGGFNIVQEATNNANVNNATYIGFAVA